jgi:hypothetical protein
MNHPLDKIFRDKLADHSLPAPESAWSKVATATAKKNSAFGLFRMAAGLLLLCAVTAVLVWLTRPEKEPGLATTIATTVKDQPVSASPVPATIQDTARNKMKSAGPAKILKVREQKLAEVQQAIPEKVHEPEVKVMPQPEAVTIESVAIVAPVEKAVVIEYRLEPVVTADGSTAVASKEKTSLRKVIDFAMDVKNSSPLGDLRDAKDDLFAFNFKKEKQNNAK